MVVAGNVKTAEVKALAEKWFGEIPAGETIVRDIPKEPEQNEERVLEVKADVPVNAIYKGYKVCARRDEDYQATDLLRDILSSGDSSRLYQKLVKDKKLFSNISAYLSETVDEGLLMIDGRLSEGVSMDDANKAIEEVVNEIAKEKISDDELTKVKNKIEALMTFSDTNILNRAMNLAYFEMLGNPDEVNKEIDKYKAVTADKLQQVASKVFRKENCNTIRYFSNN